MPIRTTLQVYAFYKDLFDSEQIGSTGPACNVLRLQPGLDARFHFFRDDQVGAWRSALSMDERNGQALSQFPYLYSAAAVSQRHQLTVRRDSYRFYARHVRGECPRIWRVGGNNAGNTIVVGDYETVAVLALRHTQCPRPCQAEKDSFLRGFRSNTAPRPVMNHRAIILPSCEGTHL